MKIFANIRTKLEQWLIDDVLDGSDVYTNTNAESNDFVRRYGINQLCLLEMYDDTSKNFYGSDAAGFGFAVSFDDQITAAQLEVLKKLIDDLQEGFGLQISSVSNQQKLIVTAAYDVAFSDNSNVSKMNQVKAEMASLLSTAFVVEDFTADDFLSYATKLCCPKYFWQDLHLAYDDNFFIRDQILSADVINVAKSHISFVSDEPVVMTACGVQQYFSKHIEAFDAQNYMEFLDKDLVVNAFREQEEILLLTLGAFKPIKKHQSNFVDIKKQNLHVYHTALHFKQNKKNDSEDELASDAVSDVQRQMRLYDYTMSAICNRQLAALMFSLPMSLSAKTAEDIFSLRLSKNVKSVSLNDVFPLLCNSSVS